MAPLQKPVDEKFEGVLEILELQEEIKLTVIRNIKNFNI
jgi:hypothetical protein